MTRRLFIKQPGGRLYVGLLLALVVLRLLFVPAQRVFLMTESSSLDDMLMLRGAVSITAGQWLGPYSALAIAKNMGFAVWLALLHALGIPYLWGNALLWVAACLFATWALQPLVQNRWGRLLLFAFLAFQPYSFALFNARTYRDAVFPAFCLLLFAGALGLALRLRRPGLRGVLLCSLAAGTGLAGGWLLREDGAVLLAFAACGLALVLLYIVLGKKTEHRLAKALCALLPMGILAGGILAFSAVNASHYGVFLVNDLNGGGFPGAYASLAAVSEGESGHTHRVPVTKAALEKMYAEVPLLAELRPHLQAGPAYYGYANLETGEFGGSFYYALRIAAQQAGKTPDAVTAQSFWRELRAQVNRAVAEGRLQSARPSASVLPRWNASLLAPTLAETGHGFWMVMTFDDCDIRPLPSTGSAESIREVEAYIASPAVEALQEGTDQAYFNRYQRVAYLGFDILLWAYRILIWPLIALALYTNFRALARSARTSLAEKRFSFGLLLGLLLFGLLLSLLLRLVVAAYMEAAAFGIGTYSMYLSSGLPPLLLYAGCGAALFAQGKAGSKASAGSR